jgi:hypothetical protein
MSSIAIIELEAIDAMKQKILLYKSNSSIYPTSVAGLTLVGSPVSCLHEATANAYTLIAVVFGHGSLRERDALIELCFALRRNRNTMKSVLLCILESKHRKLLERLRDAGVEYVMFVNSKNLDPEILKSHLETFSLNLFEEYKIERVLSEVCPFITYFSTSSRQEILYCGAYRNRLVLGKYLLSHFCETANYKNCQYFENPLRAEACSPQLTGNHNSFCSGAKEDMEKRDQYGKEGPLNTPKTGK